MTCLASMRQQRVGLLRESSNNVMGFPHSHFIRQTIHTNHTIPGLHGSIQYSLHSCTSSRTYTASSSPLVTKKLGAPTCVAARIKGAAAPAMLSTSQENIERCLVELFGIAVIHHSLTQTVT